MIKRFKGIRSLLFPVILVSLFILPVILFASGTMEPDVDGSCGTCHSSTPQYPILGARTGYDESGHKTIGNSYYANGNGCQQCHTNEGFIEYVNTGKVEGYVRYPSQIGCFTCHTSHETGDLALRATKPVKLANGAVFDSGDGNLCANCHQARQVAAKTVAPMPANKISSHWGAHHGPQSDMVAGTNAYEFEGKSYSNSAHTVAIADGCVSCHMSLPEGRYSLSPAIGGHSFNIEGEVHEAEKVNTSGCLSCHPEIKQAKSEPVFEIVTVDYDLDGAMEPIQIEVEGLLEKMVNSEGTGVLQTLAIPMYKKDGSWNATQSEEVRPLEQVGALYNYKFVEEDRSKGIHNTKYAIQLLYDSIAALDPRFNTSHRPE